MEWRKPSTRGRPSVLLRRLLHWAGVDRAVVFGILKRIWFLATGPVTMLLIASHFTRELQGYYYTFGSILALNVFIELGLGQVILQFASHEWSRLSLDAHGRIVGDSQALSRLVSLGRFAFKWYAVGGALVAVGLGSAGFGFFAHAPQIGIKWMAPWFALCFLSGVNLFSLSVWSLLEGCNQVGYVYAYQFSQAILSSLVIWLAIWCGAGLWTAPITCLVGLLWGLQFLYRRYKNFLRTFRVRAAGSGVSWRNEMLPFQWRIAVSWLSGYFCFSLFTPALFRFRGPIPAGQMGMTWSMVSVLSAISATWVFAKAPHFGVLVARKEYAALERLVLRSGAVSFGMACCGAIVLEGAVYLLNILNHPLAARLLPPLPTGLFLLATVLMQISYPQSAYLRAHKKEPFLSLSVASGLLTGLCTVILGSRYGATGMGAGYLAVAALLVLPMGTIICYRCRAAWHAPLAEDQQVTPEAVQMKESNRLVRAAPSLSVIMCNYNDASYIGEALKAILAQSLRPREVIVVDDGSTDNSIAVIEEFIQRDPIVRLLRNERNMGVPFSANRGVDEASGDYVCFASANDYILPGLFEKSLRLLAQYPQAGFCSALTMFLKEDGKESGPYPSPPLISKTECYVPPERVFVTWRRNGEWWFMGQTALYRRNALIEAGGLIPELRGDCDHFMQQLLAFKYGACFIPEALGMYRILENCYSAELATEKYGDLTKMEVRHMRSTHGSVFPKQYVEAFRKQNVYSQAWIASRKLKLQYDECLTQTENSLETPTLVDRLFFSALRLSMSVRHLCLRLYLFLRLKHLSWFLLMRRLYDVPQNLHKW